MHMNLLLNLSKERPANRRDYAINVTQQNSSSTTQPELNQQQKWNLKQKLHLSLSKLSRGQDRKLGLNMNNTTVG